MARWAVGFPGGSVYRGRVAYGESGAEMSVDRPLWIARLGFSLWMAIWLPIILSTQGPQNFWWLCNLAQFLLLYALWHPNRLVISSQAGTVLAVGFTWTLDFIVGLFVGDSITGIAAYMFDPEYPLIQRATSTYHIWLPLLFLWLCHRYGYDRRGVWLQAVIGSLAIVGGWLWGDPERNLNYTHAPFGVEQTWLPDIVYIPLLCLGTALFIYVPGHFVVRGILELVWADRGCMRVNP